MATQIVNGTDPIGTKKAEREAAPARTFEALARRYMKEHAERHKRPRSAEEDRRNLAVHVLPKWGKRDFRTLRRGDVIELVESIVGTGKHGAGNRVHALVSKIFSFAVDADLIEANPAARLRKRGVENVGRRILSDEEICAFWKDIVLPPVSPPVGLALRLALLVGARVNEIAGARKTEFSNLEDPARATWLIPAERAKNKRDHLIALAPLALETVNAAAGLSKNSEFLFPSRANGRGSIGRHALTFAMRAFGRRLEEPKSWKAEPPTPHDLRRTLNTRLAQAGVPKEVRDRALSHVTGLRDPESLHYNRYQYDKEKRAALCQWAAEIETLLKRR
jgi:integrase